MGKTRYAKLREMLDKLKKENGDIINFDILKTRFMMEIGSAPETKKEAIPQMLELKMIEELSDGRIKIA